MESIIPTSKDHNELDMASMLRQAGLRPTRQRILLASLLFGAEKCHVNAEALAAKIVQAGEHMATATIYNCLHQFEEAGLLRPVHHAGDAVLYDTNLGDHYHFVDVETGTIMDIDPGDIALPDLLEIPQGYEAESIELTVRLRRKN